MSQERMFAVEIPVALEPRVRALQASAAACLRRYESAAAGDDTEVDRYQQIQAEIDAIACAELMRQVSGEPPGPRSGLTVDVMWPFAQGATDKASLDAAQRMPVQEMWRPSSGLKKTEEHGYRHLAIAERFEAQLARWLTEGSAADATPPICPSDIKNDVLSESLRKYIAQDGRVPRTDASVVYKDGSHARPLPLRSLAMSDEPPTAGERVLRLTLMSIRHPTLDLHVDGAWLRNREISISRPYAATDEIAYMQSRESFAKLSRSEPIAIELFQTGLEAANVGFYRALADHHLEGTGFPVTVVPRYYKGRDDSPDDFLMGTVWRVSAA